MYVVYIKMYSWQDPSLEEKVQCLCSTLYLYQWWVILQSGKCYLPMITQPTYSLNCIRVLVNIQRIGLRNVLILQNVTNIRLQKSINSIHDNIQAKIYDVLKLKPLSYDSQFDSYFSTHVHVHCTLWCTLYCTVHTCSYK